MCSRQHQSQLNAIQGMLFYKYKNIKVWYSEEVYSIIHFFMGDLCLPHLNSPPVDSGVR